MTTPTYTPSKIEPKWQNTWEEGKAFATTEEAGKPNTYVLEMLPYPSGQLHMGHVRNYTLGDVLARFKRAQGHNVLHPMGWDAFGLPAENAALKRNIHPESWTLNNIEEMKTTMKSFGWSYDWDKEVASCLPSYYGHQQKLFIEMMKKGLVYQKETIVNWDPVENTVLANEQVVDGKGWRSGVAVERRTMQQWHFKITQYAEELLSDLDKLDGWPERVKTMQRNWIGKSEGLTFSFDVFEGDNKVADMPVYTTRPDTIYGVSFCCVAPEHPFAKQAAEQSDEAKAFIKDCEALGTSEEAIERAEKRGFKTNFTAKHPITGEMLPIYIANFVLMTYGSGAIMAVPAHDERDNAFAKKYDLPIMTVVQSSSTKEGELYSGAGTLVNSGEFTGMHSEEAKAAIIKLFEDKHNGEKTTNWRLRDWGLGRQRYWGCPIPVVHCDDCGIVPVPDDQLPVELPKDVTFDKPGNPLENHPTWKKCTCPTCGAPATRETDTMDTFVDSSWYFLRYICAQDTQNALDSDKVNFWMGRDDRRPAGGVTQYIGGIEHAVLHLLYARFFTKALRDCGYLDMDEPFAALLCQGMLIGNTYQAANGDYIYPSQVNMKDGKAFHKDTGEELTIKPAEKISKSKNNGDAPDALIEKYGADTLRLFMMFTAPPERDLEWNETAIEGGWRFLNRVWTLAHSVVDYPSDRVAMADLTDKAEQNVKRAIHKTIKKVTADADSFHYNTMIAACMELSNTLNAAKPDASDAMPALIREGAEILVQLLNPTCPHITEELWSALGHEASLAHTSWPTFEAAAAKDDEITLVVQVNGKTKAKLTAPADIDKDAAIALAKDAVTLDGTVRKEIYVPGRLVNLVAA